MADGARRLAATLLALAGALALNACAETELAINTAKRIAPGTSESTTANHGLYKVGKPYQVNGVWYYPHVDYSYDETGIASWYGPDFHEKRTANGEVFDMNALTAAHKTLPLPPIVRVINLRNGRAVKLGSTTAVRSSTAASSTCRAAPRSCWASRRKGTAPVRVEVIADESRQLRAGPGGPRYVRQPCGGPAGHRSSLAGAAAPSCRGSSWRAASTVVGSGSCARTGRHPTSPSSGQGHVRPGRRLRPARLCAPACSAVSRDRPARVVEAVVGERVSIACASARFPPSSEADQMLAHVLALGQCDARLVVE